MPIDDSDALMDEPFNPLKLVPNDLDNAAHARLDQEAFKVANSSSLSRPLPANEPIFAALSLLAIIVSTSEGLLDAKYQQTSAAVALFGEHPELKEKLMQAWMARTFRDIRNMSAIFPCTMNTK